MLVMTSKGLYCPAGDFYIDPMGAVDHAVITHAHSDHARRGSRQYYCAASGASLLRTRLGKNISVRSIPFGVQFQLNGVVISLHPAGHILGSAQVRLERADRQGGNGNGNEVWVVSGDYKRDADPTCEPFEVVSCDVFVTEATFGTPGFTWPKEADLGKEIFEWWSENVARGVNSVLYAYSLGKAQRVLGLLRPHVREGVHQIFCHPAATPLNECYRAQGVALASTICLSEVDVEERPQGGLFLVPQSFLKAEQAQILGHRYETAFASGWMKRTAYGYDRGFILSDHADWNDLLSTIIATGAKRVYVQHRGNGALVRHLKSIGLQAFPDTDLKPGESGQLALF